MPKARNPKIILNPIAVNLHTLRPNLQVWYRFAQVIVLTFGLYIRKGNICPKALLNPLSETPILPS